MAPFLSPRAALPRWTPPPAAVRAGRVAGMLLLLFGAPGCLPLASVAASAVSGLAGGGGNAGGPAVANPGPFAGAPSAAQNRSPYDPAISEALAQAEHHEVSAQCRAKLPPPAPLPETGCAMRDTCLPGSAAPMRLQLCAQERGSRAPAAPDDGAGWRWTAGGLADAAPAAETAADRTPSRDGGSSRSAP